MEHWTLQLIGNQREECHQQTTHLMVHSCLGFPSCSKLGIVELNCAVHFCWKKLTQEKPTTEHQQVQKDLTNLKQLNTKEE